MYQIGYLNYDINFNDDCRAQLTHYSGKLMSSNAELPEKSALI